MCQQWTRAARRHCPSVTEELTDVQVYLVGLGWPAEGGSRRGPGRGVARRRPLPPLTTRPLALVRVAAGAAPLVGVGGAAGGGDAVVPTAAALRHALAPLQRAPLLDLLPLAQLDHLATDREAPSRERGYRQADQDRASSF